VLALWLNSWQALAVLALFSLLWSSGRVKPSLLAKAHLFLFAALGVCLLGAAYIPAPGGGMRGGPGLSVRMAVLPALRVAVSMNMALALVMSSPASALSRFIAAAKLPDPLFVPLSVALRFVAVFVSELPQVKDALEARTGEPLARTALSRPWRLWRGFLAPMVFRALASADSLALSLEMKGLRSKSLFWKRAGAFPAADRARLARGAAALGLCLAVQYREAVAALAFRAFA
jgi:energy-coupling factor transporter transmembrane protein EcfT